MADLFNIRRVLLWGSIGFVLFSGLIALSHHLGFLIAMRALQGIGAAALLPNCIALIYKIYDEKQRNIALGILVAVMGLSMAIGPSIGGFMLTLGNWRWIFWFNIPIGIAMIVLGYFALPKEPRSKSKHRDFFPMHILKNRSFFSVSLNRSFLQYSFLSTLFFLGLMLQNVLAFTTSTASFIFLALTASYGISSIFSGYLLNYFGHRNIILMGNLIATLGLLNMALYTSRWPLWTLLSILFLVGLSLGFLVPALNGRSLQYVEEKDASAASGIFQTFSYLGGSIGVAISTWLQTKIGRDTLAHLLRENHIELPSLQLETLNHLSSGIRPFSVLNTEPPLIHSLVTQAFFTGHRWVFILAAVGMLFSWALSVKIIRSTSERRTIK